MILQVDRFAYYPDSTIGRLSIDGSFFSYTLEDVVRLGGTKVAGSTAIPDGSYQVIVNYSPKFKRDLPLLLNVPGFSGIRIHRGNTSSDTEGCILVGRSWRKDFVGESKVMEIDLVKKLNNCITNKGIIWIEVRNIIESDKGGTQFV